MRDIEVAGFASLRLPAAGAGRSRRCGAFSIAYWVTTCGNQGRECGNTHAAGRSVGKARLLTPRREKRRNETAGGDYVDEKAGS